MIKADPVRFWTDQGQHALFGQMYEDAEVEVGLLDRASGGQVFSIASGGCTALSLLTQGVTVDAVDANPGQLALVQHKLDCLGNVDAVLRLNRSGAIDKAMEVGRTAFRTAIHPQTCIESLLQQEDAREFYRTVWNTWPWRLVFSLACSRTVLGRVFNRSYTRQLPYGFADLMRQRVEDAILGSPPCRNPYLHQAMLGGFTKAALPLYLREPVVGRPHLFAADAATWLAQQPANRYDCLFLSNILDLSTPEYASRLGAEVRRTARKGALVCIRFIFPPPQKISDALSQHLRLDAELSAQACKMDRSLFCKFIRVYR